MSSTSRWRAPVTGAVAGLVVAAAVVGPSALASGSKSAAGQAGAKHAHATDASCTTSAAGAKAPAGNSGPGPGPFLDAVAQLKQAGTITDAEARIIDADIQAGSIDPQQLVASGTLTSAQMQAVADRLGAVKRGLAAAMNQGSPAPGAAQGKAPQG
ncbi:MAG: hypothetical protein JO363_21180 [Solirubrobacterales bacterium]|nr:hypothetical protein [Solirubrobacterales bacterium]